MDVNLVADLVGSMTAPAALGFFVGRTLAGPSGVSEVERLKRAAGIAEPGAPAPSRLREWLPYLMGVLGGIFGLVVGIGPALDERNVAIQKEMESGFTSGCLKGCQKGARPQGCQNYCGCMLSDLERRHPNTKDLQASFRAGIDKSPAATAEYSTVQTRCFSEYMVDQETSQ